MSPWPGLIVAGGIGIWAVVALWVIGLGCNEEVIARRKLDVRGTTGSTAASRGEIRQR